MKRQRGRGRKPGGGGGQHHHNHHQPNRAMESNGPEGGKVRGNASLIYERYLQLARDAASSGDRVLSENYLQHADHYFRLVRAMQPAVPVQQPVDRFANEQDYEGGEEEAVGEAEAGDDPEGPGERAEQPDAEISASQQAQNDGDFRRSRRGRRNRFRPDGEREAEGSEGRDASERQASEAPEARSERRERQPRQPRERDGDLSGPEGFSNGPKPAFLRSE